MKLILKISLFILAFLGVALKVEAQPCYYEFPEIRYNKKSYYCYLKLNWVSKSETITYHQYPGTGPISLPSNVKTHIACYDDNDRLLNQKDTNYVYRRIDGVVDDNSILEDYADLDGEHLSMIINHQYLSEIVTYERDSNVLGESKFREAINGKIGEGVVCPNVYLQQTNEINNGEYDEENYNIKLGEGYRVPRLFLSYGDEHHGTDFNGNKITNSMSCMA